MQTLQRYFIEVRYNGSGFSGFQVQENAVTVQGELEKALAIYTRKQIVLTGSSRTDGGVHAWQNFFHFDWEGERVGDWEYHLNAILPEGIAVMGVYSMPMGAHCRFDAIGRQYQYTLYQHKDPFMQGRGWRYPYPMEESLLQEAAAMIKGTHNFQCFCKRGVQVNNFNCAIDIAEWEMLGDRKVFRIRGNRFLRGMVRALVGTMVRIGRGEVTLQEWGGMIAGEGESGVKWLAPAEGLVLERVIYPADWSWVRG